MLQVIRWLIPTVSVLSVVCVILLSRFFRVRHVWLKGTTPVLRTVTAFLFPYIRRSIYAASLIWATWVYWYEASAVPAQQAALTSMMRWFGITGIFLLFITFLPGIIRVFFPTFTLNPLLIHARRALGVSVFFFGCLHGTIGYFVNLSGTLLSITFLSDQNQIAIVCSSSAFVILSLLALTSFDGAVRFMTQRRWKILHRFVYLAAILLVFHAFFIGSHYTTPTGVIPLLTNYAALTVLLLEVAATIRRRRQKQVRQRFFGNLLWWFGVLTVVGGAFYVSSITFLTPYDPHASHRRGYSKNYSVAIETNPQQIEANSPVQIRFRITDRRNGRQVRKFQVIQEKLMHLVILRDDLSTYDHIHPDMQPDGSFLVTTQFPEEGAYTLYVEYSPPDFSENVSTVSIRTKHAQPAKARLSVGAFSKIFADKYKVTITPTGPFKVNDTIDLVYTIADAKTGRPVEDLEPYLAAFGHLAAVSEDGQTYTHVHPIDVPLTPQSVGGPVVRFSTFFTKAGKYKLFAQFKQGGGVFVTDFVIDVH